MEVDGIIFWLLIRSYPIHRDADLTVVPFVPNADGHVSATKNGLTCEFNYTKQYVLRVCARV